MRGSGKPASAVLRLVVASSTASGSAAVGVAAHAARQPASTQQHTIAAAGAAAAATKQRVLWSAAIGNKQIPWHLCSNSTITNSSSSRQLMLFATDAAGGGSSGSAVATQQQQQPEQQQPSPAALNFSEQTDDVAEQLQSAAAAAAADAASNSSSSSSMSPAMTQQMLQQHANMMTNSNSSVSSKTLTIPSDITLNDVLAGGPGMSHLVSLICAASHKQQPQNPQQQQPSPELNPSQLEQQQQLKPFQLDPRPSCRVLDEQERLTMAGQRGFRLSEEAAVTFNGLLSKFVRSKALRETARKVQLPKALLPQASSGVKRYLQRSVTPGFLAALLAAGVVVPPQQQSPLTPANTFSSSSGVSGISGGGNSTSQLLAAAAAAATGDAGTGAATAAAAAAAAGGGGGQGGGVIEGSSSSSGGGGGGVMEQQQQQQQQSLKQRGRVPSYTAEVEGLLLPVFAEYCQQHYQQEIAAYVAAVSTLDLRSPHKWFPFARAVKRKIIYHGGPTNSGKTYNALQSLAAAERGIYCAPLRLLAMEVYETLNHRGVYCDLVTGQEVMQVPGSSHVSCTVEMANINSHFDVAVIDEIQLIGDQQRGFAWSRALLGLPANTIHVCGDTSAVALIRHLAGVCGDDFEFHTYERMTPLKLDTQGLPNGWSDVQPGDAVVAFSRRNIYKARRAIEAATSNKTCIVYGALPAETRRHQARLFNNPHSGVNVLIASDAVGLGLNFNIRRVIFTTLTKRARGGRDQVKVPVSLVKQIAGRAGRRNSIYPEGCATTLDPKDLPYLRKALEAPPSSLYTPAAGLAPEYETLELLAAQFPALSLEELLKKLDAEARLDGRYFLCKQEQLVEAARVLRWVKGLSLQDQFTLINAPIDVYDDIQRGAFIDYASTYAAGQPVLFNEGLMPQGPPRTEADMEQAENLHKIMGCWLWLSYRFEDGAFPGRERVQVLTRQLCEWLNTGLANIQTTEELLAAQAAAAAAERRQRQQQQQQQEDEDEPAGVMSGNGSSSSSIDSALQAAVAAATGEGAAAAGAPGGAAAGSAAAATAAAGTSATASAAAAGGAQDSSDVDEYSDTAFTVHVEEVSAEAADRGYDGELVSLLQPPPTTTTTNDSSSSSSSGVAAAAAAAAATSPPPAAAEPAALSRLAAAAAALAGSSDDETTTTTSTTTTSSSTSSTSSSSTDSSSSSSSSTDATTAAEFKLTRAQLKRLQKLQRPYISWTSAVATGSLAALTSYNPVINSGSSSASSLPGVSSSGAAATSTTSHSSSLLDAAATSGGGDVSNVEDWGALMMPEFEPSMGAFVRWRMRPRFKVPPPPTLELLLNPSSQGTGVQHGRKQQQQPRASKTA